MEIFLHLDKYLAQVISQYGTLAYAILFLIIFMETGFIVTPFLPGDSLLFAAGALSAIGALNIWSIYILLFIAAVLGDTVNYWIGHFLGQKLTLGEPKLTPDVSYPGHFRSVFIKKEYLEKTQKFYDKYGNSTIVLARFVPIVRTFAPFVAGVAKMSYKHFITYNIIGGFLWVTLFTWGGYFFGNLPFIKANFEYVVLAIILLSIAPMIIGFFRSSKKV